MFAVVAGDGRGKRRRGRSGGAGGAGGFNFQERFAAFIACKVLAEVRAAPLWDWSEAATFESVYAESGEAADDVFVTSSVGRAYVQAKLTLDLSDRSNSEFAKTISQFVRQYLTSARGSVFDSEDRLVLALGPEASSRLRADLPRVLAKLASLRPDQELNDAAGSKVEEKVLTAFLAHARRAWKEEASSSPTDAELIEFAGSIRVGVFDLAEEGRDAKGAQELLRSAVLSRPEQAGSAWDQLNSRAAIFAETQTGADRARLQQHLLQRGIDLEATPSYRTDIERLREHSRRMLRRLEATSKIAAPGGEAVKIDRPIAHSLSDCLITGSLLVTGEPGIGKSSLLHGQASAATETQREVLVLLAEALRVESRADLQAELGLEHDLLEVLRNWPAADSGLLVVDGIDSARGEGSQALLLEVIAEALVDVPGWTVLASIRRFDLRYNQRLRDAFSVVSAPQLPEELRSPEFADIRHLLVSELGDEEIEQLASQAPALRETLARATPALRELARVPINLRLLAELLAGNVAEEELEPITTQLQLLDAYWKLRVSGSGDGARSGLLRQMVRTMLAERALQIARSDVENVESAKALEGLLSDGVLSEQELGDGSIEEETLTFSHAVLFDYAVERLLFRGASLSSVIAKQPDLVLQAGPSLDLHFRHLWSLEQGREQFWDVVAEINESDEVPEIAKVLGPAVAASLVRDLGDLAPLLAGLTSSSTTALAAWERLLRHFVAALVGDRPRPLTAEANRVAIGTALAAELADGKLDGEKLGSLVDLVSALLPLLGTLNSAERANLGRAARALLSLVLAAPEGVQRALSMNAISAVARTYATDPQASAELLRGLLTPERLKVAGHLEMPDLCEEVDVLLAEDPILVRDIYVAVFEFEETSKDSTPITQSAILPLISNRSQDYRMAHYALARAFPDFLAEAPVSALEALAAVRLAYASRHSSGLGIDEEITIDWGTQKSKILGDGSSIFDRNPVANDDELKMLGDFEKRLDQLAEDGDSELERLLELCREQDLPASIWRRVLSSATRHPAAYGDALLPLLRSADALADHELQDAIAQLLGSGLDRLPEAERRAIEDGIVALPETYKRLRPDLGDSARELGEHARDGLLAHLEANDLLTEEAKASVAKRAEREAEAGKSPEPAWAEPEPWGIDRAEPIDLELEALLKPLREFESDHLNSIPTPDQAAAIEAPLRAAWEHMRKESSPADARTSDPGASLVASVAGTAAIAFSASGAELAKEILLAAAQHPLPRHNPERDEQFDKTQAWDGESPRIKAAAGLCELLGREDKPDGEVLEAIERLSEDPDPAVRFHVVRRLGRLRLITPELMWAIADRVAESDVSYAVKEKLVCALPQVAPGEIRKMGEIAETLLDATPHEERSEKLRTRSAELLADLYVWHDDAAVGDFLRQRILTDPVGRTEEIRHVCLRLRDPLVHGGEDARHVALRGRAVGLLAAALESAAPLYHQELQALKDTLDPEEIEERQAQLRSAAEIVDEVANEVYFASGVFQERQGEATIGPEQRERLYRETAPLLDCLAEIGHPKMTHRLLETLEGFIEFDPRGVFMRIAQAIEVGSRSGYQVESLAATLFVRLTERYLAEYRSLFRTDAEARAALIAMLDTFVEAGWPQARALTYGLHELFR